MHEIIVGTKPRQPLSATEVSRDGSYLQLSGPLPVGINRSSEASRLEDFTRFICRKSD